MSGQRSGDQVRDAWKASSAPIKFSIKRAPRGQNFAVVSVAPVVSGGVRSSGDPRGLGGARCFRRGQHFSENPRAARWPLFPGECTPLGILGPQLKNGNPRGLLEYAFQGELCSRLDRTVTLNTGLGCKMRNVESACCHY